MHFHWGDLNTHSNPILSRKISGHLVVTGADRRHWYSEGLAGPATLSAVSRQGLTASTLTSQWKQLKTMAPSGGVGRARDMGLQEL